MATMTEAHDPTRVGRNIAAARRGVGMSQATLAQLAGVNRQNLSDWERGVHEPRASTLMRLARTLRLPLDWFYQNHDGGPGR